MMDRLRNEAFGVSNWSKLFIVIQLGKPYWSCLFGLVDHPSPKTNQPDHLKPETYFMQEHRCKCMSNALEALDILNAHRNIAEP